MNGYNIAVLVLMVLGMGIEMGRHGEKKDGTHNFFISLLSALIYIWLLIKGGFFN